jgi:signal transduction histidine kinase
MSLSRHAVVALLVAAVATVAGLAVWTNGRVDLGLRLETVDGVVRVADVTPDGIAARNGVLPGQTVTFLQTLDGRRVSGGQVRHELRDGGTDGGEIVTKTVQLPGEAVEEPAIAALEVGYDDGTEVYPAIQLARDVQMRTLLDTSWLVVVGLALGAVSWFALSRGAAGGIGRAEAVVIGAAVATPLAIMPVVVAGTAEGIAGGYLAAGAASLVAGSALVAHHPEPGWQRAGWIAGAILLALTALLVVRYLSAPSLPSVDMRGQIVALVTATALVPALFAAGAASELRDRTALVSLGLVPGAAGSVIAIGGVTLLPLLIVAGLIAWQLLPLGRVGAAVKAGLPASRVVTAPPIVGRADPQVTERRDIIALLLGGLAVVVGAAQENAWALIIGLALGGLAAYALRRGFLGAEWADAAAPIGVAIAIPILMVGPDLGYGGGRAAIVFVTIAALIVAHLVAWRHPDAGWRGRHFAASAVLSAFAVVQASGDSSGGALIVSGLVPLVPAVSLTLMVSRPGALAVVGRLETLVVAVTPGIAMLAMVNGPTVLILLAWFAAVLVWRRFTLAPLLGFAQRSQQQLDLAVAAAEQERARLAADLHDEALQELTGLVRRLDEAGDQESADLARGVAERLRGITSDLRLPLLDDLGAGPALEWLVARVRPMAGGEVRLERSDPSRPPSAVELAVFRVAQEALANAVKHGKAPITVRYHVDEAGHVTLTVDDAGPGIDLKAAEGALASGHLGMANMHQRAEQIGALLNVRAWPTGGTHVGLEWRPQ